MRNKKTIRIAVSLTLAALLLGGLYPMLAYPHKALVVRLIGKARIKAPGQNRWRPLRINTVVSDKSWVETGGRSRLVIMYKGTQVRLGPRTKVRINSLANNGPGNVHVARGFSWFKVKKRKFKVSSPTAIASVRGTKFAVVHDHRGTATCTCEGLIATKPTAGGSEKKVPAGYSNTYAKDGTLVPKDFRKYFKGLKVDRSFQSRILKDPKLNGCKSCHRMTNLATDTRPDPKNY